MKKVKLLLIVILSLSMLVSFSNSALASEILETEETEQLDDIQDEIETLTEETEENEESVDEIIEEIEELETVEEIEETTTDEVLEVETYLVNYQINLADDVDTEVLDYITTDIPNTISIGDNLNFKVFVPVSVTISSLNINGTEYNYEKIDEDTNEYFYSITNNFDKDLNIIINVSNLEINNSISLMAVNQNATSGTLDSTSDGIPITIDGYYDDWSDKPYSWHYNWDNSDNCWNNGCWYNGICYITPTGTYDNNVRHLMQMYTDGEYIYVRIKIATIYGSLFNGEAYSFTFNNGEKACFQIRDENGNLLTNNIKNHTPGIHQVQVRHENNAVSSYVVDGASACLTVYDDFHNTDLEFKIPLAACVEQNPNIDLDNTELISFFTPNLMYQSIQWHGTPTLPWLLIGILIAICGVAEYKYFKDKKNK